MRCGPIGALLAAGCLAASGAAATELPAFDADSGRLVLPAVPVRRAAATACFDVTLTRRVDAADEFELQSADPRGCGAISSAADYDADAGTLQLAGVAVRQAGAVSCWDAVLRLLPASPLRLRLAGAVAAPCAVAAPPTAASPVFRGNLVLGTPTDRSIRANVYSADQAGTVWLSWGLSPDAHNHRIEPLALTATQPLEIAIDGLLPDVRYHYRLHFRPSGAAADEPVSEASFHTARAPGSRFVFTLQGDSHPERLRSQFDPDLYVRTLQTAAADQPDFHLLLGDDFSVDTLNAATVTRAQVVERYTMQRPWLGLIGRSAPLFLVNGNHEQAARYLLDGTPDNVAVWAQNARNSLYAQPAPDHFYSGNPEPVPHIGLLRNHFAWTWGDALFVVLDPYWSSPVPVDGAFGDRAPRAANGWDITHGDAQYRWLERTLAGSRARWKFVFAHHVMGTGRGGIEVASRWEWGGRDTRGLFQFPTFRPTWSRTIHQLMVDHGVTIFFQGHDHTWVRQQLDGVTYQTLSEPADPNYALYFDDAYTSGDQFPNTGYTRVTVTPDAVTVQYVRTWLPRDEGPGRVSGQPVFGYTLR